MDKTQKRRNLKMFVYLFTYIFIIFAYFYVKKCNVTVQQNRLICSLIIFVLWFVSAFRAAHIGKDHFTYNGLFYSIGATGDAYCEKGYVLLNRILYFIYDDPIILSIGVSSLLIFSYAYYVKHNVNYDYWILAILIFVFQPYLYIQSSFNVLRQGCATAFVMLAIPNLIEKKKFKYFAWIAIACLFHFSAVIFFLLFFLQKFNLNFKRIIFIAFISLVLNFVNAFSFLFAIISQYQAYENYEESLLNIKPYVLFIFGVTIYFASKYNTLFHNEKEKMFVDIFLISLCLLIVFVQNDMLYRVYIMFAFISVPGITIIFKNILKNNSLVEAVLLGYYNFFYIGYTSRWYLNNDFSYYPFKFAFE